LHRPATLAAATGLLAQLSAEEARVIAGGQSLAAMMAFRLARPRHLVDINGVGELAGVSRADGHIEIRALVRHEDLRRNPPPGLTGALLESIAPHIAHRPIRARGTLCGSLAHADPASEWCLAALTLDAVMTAASARGRREIEACDFFQGAMTTALAPDEILASARFPELPGTTRYAFQEFARRAGDFALAMSLVVFEIERGRMRRVRLGVGGVEDRPRRLSAAESLLEGESPSIELFDRAARIAGAALTPMEDVRTDALYRRGLAASLIRRALTEAAK
jgi:carbon-monoxide dehydrogenase medium subunit